MWPEHRHALERTLYLIVQAQSATSVPARSALLDLARFRLQSLLEASARPADFIPPYGPAYVHPMGPRSAEA